MGLSESHSIRENEIVGSISESRLFALVDHLGLAFICATQYFVTMTTIVWSFLVDGPWIIKLVPLGLAVLGLEMLPLWYRTFFDPAYVGLDHAIAVQWSRDTVWFRGAYFDIEVPIENVVEYATYGPIRLAAASMLKLRVRTNEGRTETIWLSTAMRQKQVFSEFLKASGARGVSP